LYLVNEKTTLKTDILLDDGWNIGYPSLPMDVGYAEARIFSISLLKTIPIANGKIQNIKFMQIAYIMQWMIHIEKMLLCTWICQAIAKHGEHL
jgi:hypothetical protein